MMIIIFSKVANWLVIISPSNIAIFEQHKQRLFYSSHNSPVMKWGTLNRVIILEQQWNTWLSLFIAYRMVSCVIANSYILLRLLHLMLLASTTEVFTMAMLCNKMVWDGKSGESSGIINDIAEMKQYTQSWQIHTNNGFTSVVVAHLQTPDYLKVFVSFK